MRTTVQAPDGGYVTVEHPDDASEDDVLSYAQANYKPTPLKIGKAGLLGAAEEVGSEKNIIGKLGTGIGTAGQRLMQGATDLISAYQRDPAERAKEREERDVASATVRGAGPVAQGAELAADVGIGFGLPVVGLPTRGAVAESGRRVLAKTLAGQTALGAAGSPDNPVLGGALGGGGAVVGTALPAVRRMVQARREAPGMLSTGRAAALARQAGTTPEELAGRIEQGVARGAEYNVPLTTAQAARSPELAGRELGARGILPEEFTELTRRQNEALYEAAQRGSRGAPHVEAHAARRGEITAPLRERALTAAGQDPWFATPVVQAVTDLTTGPTGVNPAVQSIANYVRGQLGEGAATAITPARLYEIRKVLASKLHGRFQIGDELSAAAKGAERETLGLMHSIDDALDAASGGQFRQYLARYGEASRPLENALASRMFREALDKPGTTLTGEVAGTTGARLEKAIAAANKSRFRESGRFDPRRLQELEGLVDLAKRNIDEPIRTAKLAGTGGGGSQTATQTEQMMRAGAAEVLGMATTGIPGAGTAIRVGGAGLTQAGKQEYARLLADPQRALAALRAAEAAGRPLSPAEQAFATSISQATRETAEGF